MARHDPVLISGCSSGIGAATAAALLHEGHTVYATARRTEALVDLEALGARPLALDVTSEESMIAAVKAVEAEHGRVGTLINNAGYGEYGPIEEADLDLVRTMFETNVFGLARLTQLVLPAMRRGRSGRIVNVGSMGGRLTFPAGGFYHATKYAVEAISDALRVEVRPFGIDVILVEPGLIRTNFEARVHESLEVGGASKRAASMNGTSGTSGTSGTDSAEGAARARGTEGIDAGRTEGARGTKGFDGTDGTKGPDGPDRTKGPHGANGAYGPDGAEDADGADTAYGRLLAGNERRITGGYANDFTATGPEAVAAVIVKAVESARPRSRYVVTSAAKLLINLRRFGGDRVWDATMRQQYGL
jgi:NADP-dependent 3-hydroxy acid dehydrogenase YdfG